MYYIMCKPHLYALWKEKDGASRRREKETGASGRAGTDNCHWVKIYGTYAPAARASRPGVP
jgi:hypothetical protein